MSTRPLVAFTAFALISPAVAADGVTITVHVRGAANDTGTVMCQIFRTPDGFPSTDAKATAYATATLRAGEADCVFYAQSPGKIAVAAYHDEDADAHLDTNLVGLPSEGYGFTNGATGGMFGPPSWDAAAVTIGATDATFPLTVTR